jgi:hypothetical protein
MQLKPHPAQDASALVSQLAGSGIELIDSPRFIEAIEACAAALVEPSTLAMVPALMGLPVFFARYGSVRDLIFGRTLKQYPRGRMLEDISQFGRMLEDENRAVDRPAVGEWIRSNAGPLPASDMPERVAAIVQSLATRGSEVRHGA